MGDPAVDRVVHDLANALTRMRGYGDLARRQLEPDHPAADDLGHLLQAVEEAVALTQRLRAITDGGARPTGTDTG